MQQIKKLILRYILICVHIKITNIPQEETGNLINNLRQDKFDNDLLLQYNSLPVYILNLLCRFFE